MLSIGLIVKSSNSSETDLFFHFTHNMDEVGFRGVQEHQKLMVEFPEYAPVLIRMLNNAIKEPSKYENCLNITYALVLICLNQLFGNVRCGL